MIVSWENFTGERTMLLVEPATEMPDVDELGESLQDIYGTPWGRMLSGADPDVFTVSGTATVRIPAGTPDVE